MNGCNKVSTQCVDVTAPVILCPTAVMGSHRHLPGQPHGHLHHQCRRHHVHRHPDPAGVRVHPGPLRRDHVHLRSHHRLRRWLPQPLLREVRETKQTPAGNGGGLILSK